MVDRGITETLEEKLALSDLARQATDGPPPWPTTPSERAAERVYAFANRDIEHDVEHLP